MSSIDQLYNIILVVNYNIVHLKFVQRGDFMLSVLTANKQTHKQMGVPAKMEA